MRRDLVLLVLVLGIAAVAVWFLTGHKTVGPTHHPASAGVHHTAQPRTPGPSLEAQPPGNALLEPEAAATTAKERSSTLNEAVPETPEAKEEAYVAGRVVELQDLGMEDDPASLETILSELNNRNPSIREAAVQAAVQFGSRDAIPRLQDAAAKADDPEEKADILEAIEFLKLPTLSEALNQATQSTPDASRGTNSQP